jgi:hypothetical protein
MVNSFDHSKPGSHEHNTNLKHYVAEIESEIELFGKSKASYRIKGHLNSAKALLIELRQYCKVFKLRLPKVPKLPTLNRRKMAEIIERERIRDEKAAAKRKAEHEAWERAHQAEVNAWLASDKACKHIGSDGKPAHTYSDRWTCERQREREDWEATKVEKIAAWKRGESVQLRMQYSEPALLRVRTFNADEDVAGLVGRVETSMQVQVPISGPAGAGRLFRFLKALRDAGRTYQRNGHSQHIGNFVVDSFDGETLKAGCHTITWEEILSVSDAVLAAEQAASA